MSAEQHKNETLLKLQNEVKLGRILDLFKNMPISTLQISPIGLIPKPDGNWRLNANLSHPPSKGINSYIDPEFCKVNYSSLDSILEMIYNCGKSAELANIDIKPAFKPLIVNPADFDLLGIKFDNMYYIDKCLPMGCSVSCNLFEKVSSFVQWVVETRCGLHSIDHYLDDFILVGKIISNDSSTLMNTFMDVCDELGIPIAENKTVGPSKIITFLGFIIDKVLLMVRIPEEKLKKIRNLLQPLLYKKMVSLKDLRVFDWVNDILLKGHPISMGFYTSVLRFDCSC